VSRFMDLKKSCSHEISSVCQFTLLWPPISALQMRIQLRRAFAASGCSAFLALRRPFYFLTIGLIFAAQVLEPWMRR
jgi:hypothetical protein